MATRQEAMRNAQAIEDYWRALGYTHVLAWARVALPHEGGVAVGYVVESNLHNASPPTEAVKWTKPERAA